MLLLGAVAAVASGAVLLACGSETSYSYFDVAMSVDRASVDEDLLARVNGCTLFVEGDDADRTELPCSLGNVPFDLGRAWFSTNRGKGTVRFVLSMQDLNLTELIRGTSDFVPIVPDNAEMPTLVTIVARRVEPVMPDAAVADAAADAGTLDAAPADTMAPAGDAATDDGGDMADALSETDALTADASTD